MCLVVASGRTPLNRDQPQQLERAWIDWYVELVIHLLGKFFEEPIERQWITKVKNIL